MRALLLLSILACGKPTHFPETRWESAPPPPKPPPVVTKAAPKPAMTMRRAPPPVEVAKRLEKRIENKLASIAAKPYSRCPSDLSISVARTIDGRRPGETIPGRLAALHFQPVRRDELIDAETAIKRVIAIEAAQPVVVPAGFRGDIVALGRDPEFRLFMARCELADVHTIRRAGHDAMIALLLGAAPEVALPLIHKSSFPDGFRAPSCRTDADCTGSCDPVSKVCNTQRGRLAAMLSRAELDIEDALVRAVANRLTTEQLERDRWVPNEEVAPWLFARYTRCGDSLCSMMRAQVSGKPRLVYRDRKHRSEPSELPDEPWAICYRETRSVTRAGCTSHCELDDRGSRQACVQQCAASCPPE